MGGVAELLFVYGTLLPGHLRWSIIEPFTRSHTVATTAGTLYDTGNGWPAAVFGGDGLGVRGAAVSLRGARFDDLLLELDAMEGIGAIPDASVDPYARIRVALLGGGGEAWA